MPNADLRLLGAVLCLLCLACESPAGQQAASPRTEAHDVVLIGIDTLRSDFLSCYGYPHPISPRIDRLAREGTLFTDVVSAAPWTLPSFASILSGQYPSSHGAGRRTGPQGPGGEAPKTPLSARVKLLPDLLQGEAGFESALFFDNPYLGKEWGVARRFDTVQQSTHGGQESVERALEWLRDHRNQRTFLFLHLMEPHLPYEPPEPYAGRAKKWAVADDEASPPAAGGWPSGTAIRALYAGEVAYTDHLVGTFVDGLAELGLLDQTLLVVTSDHGEEFLEHPEIEKRFYNDPRKLWGIGHGHSQFQELLSVPLIVRFPGRVPAGRRVGAMVQTLDLAPSILEWEGLDVPPTMSGVSLLGALDGRATRSYAFSEFIMYGDERKAYREGDWKVILGPKLETGELYDLATDPGETVNLKDRRPETFRRLARRLVATQLKAARLGKAQAGDSRPVVIDEETRQELHALGYLE